jgi:hypothetical protein
MHSGCSADDRWRRLDLHPSAIALKDDDIADLAA